MPESDYSDMATPNATQLLQPYEYRPLSPGPNGIRLLQVLPGTGAADIFCRIFQHTLRIDRGFGLYEALSYVWGDWNEPQQISIKDTEDGTYHKFCITKNLYAALLRLRDPDLPRTVWIDAICINQSDLEERASQVQIMARIYAYAVGVTVWLGEEADGSSELFDLMRQIATEDLNSSHNWAANAKANAKAILAPACKAVVALLTRPWFQRAWIVQEAAVARVISVTCGDAEITGTILAYGINLVLSLLTEQSRKNAMVPPVLMFMGQSEGSFHSRAKLSNVQATSNMPSFRLLPLGDLLRLFQHQKATDRRDKVYALLGLSSDNENSPHLRPDYTKTWSALFRELIVHVLGLSPHIDTYEDTEQAIIFNTGSVLATVWSVDRELVHLRSPVFGYLKGKGYNWEASLTLPHHRGSIKSGDILVFFQTAHQPSVIRPCGDHFDIVMVSLPAPPLVKVDLYSVEYIRRGLRVDWAEFVQGARRSKRKFNLIWDWTDNNDIAMHEALLDKCAAPASTSLERRFNTIRVLDDLEDFESIKYSIGNRPISSVYGPMGKHLILLGRMCQCWEYYTYMKRYFTTLKWCAWCLQVAPQRDYLLSYWYCAGPIGADLYDILKFAEDNSTETTNLGTGFRCHSWNVEPWQYQLYPVLFPDYSLPAVYDNGRASVVVSPCNGRYLTRLFVASQPPITEPTAERLYRLWYDTYFGDDFHLLIVLLSEQGAAYLHEPYFNYRAMKDPPFPINTSHISFMFCELAQSSIATWEFLERLLTSSEGHVLSANVLHANDEVLCRHVHNSVLFEHEIDVWINGNRSFNSVLRYIIDSVYSIEWMDGVPRGYRSFQRQMRYSSEISVHNTAEIFTFGMLVRWAQRALLFAMDCYILLERRRRQRRRRGSPVSSVRSTSSSAESFLSTLA